MKRKALSELMLTFLLTSMLSLAFEIQPTMARFYPGYGAGAATFYITPQYNNFMSPETSNGTWFTVDIRIANASHIAGWQVELYYNKNYLFTKYDMISIPEDMIFPPEAYGSVAEDIFVLNSTHNLIAITVSTAGGAEYSTPAWPANNGLFTVSFQIIKTPAIGEILSSLLYFAVSPEAVLGSWTIDSGIYENDLTVYDGYYQIARFGHNIGLVDVSPSVTATYGGSVVDINVTATNTGDFEETFNVTAFYNETSIETQTIDQLPPGNSTTLTFYWNTTDVVFGKYMIWANATSDSDEFTVDNTFLDGTVLVGPNIHDVAVTDVRISEHFTYSGENVSIWVDILNRGYFPETFNVTTYADLNTTTIGDEVEIGTQPVSLPGKGFTTLSFLWNTTGVPLASYTISAMASNLTQEADPTDNLFLDGKIEIFDSFPCDDIDIAAPRHIELNPSIFDFDWNLGALEVSLGNMTIDSTGYEGLLQVLGSTNGTVHLRVDQPSLEFEEYYLPENGSIQVPLWLVFDPGMYSGTYQLQMIVCGVHRLNLTVDIVHIWVCSNGCYSVAGGTATFSWIVTGGSWVYLEAQPNLPSGWSFTVDPTIGTLFETPHEVFVNITAAPDAQEGDIGSVTLRAYKNGTDILIWQFIFFSSVDNKPPTIEQIKPPTLTFNGNLLFNTTVNDKSGIEDVQLYYSVNSGPWNNQSMQWSSGDTFNSTAYISTIPHVPDNSIINYYVVATDWLRNQTQSDTQTITVRYDQAITDVKAEKTVVGQGYTTQINVTIANQGSIPNTSLKILVYANTRLIHTQVIPSLANGTAKTLIFDWSTTEIPKGSYTIVAYAVPLQDESDTTNNIYSGSTVLVSLPGDVTGDKKVDGKDITLVARYFGSTSGYPPNTDITGDGKVDGKDITLAAKNFGKSWT